MEKVNYVVYEGVRDEIRMKTGASMWFKPLVGNPNGWRVWKRKFPGRLAFGFIRRALNGKALKRQNMRLMSWIDDE